jgi:hypothetical protein
MEQKKIKEKKKKKKKKEQKITILNVSFSYDNFYTSL